MGQGIGYLNNETFYSPNVNALLELDITTPMVEEPLVLVLHTHTSEGYLADVSTYFGGDIGEITYTKNEEHNMLAVGKAFVLAL